MLKRVVVLGVVLLTVSGCGAMMDDFIKASRGVFTIDDETSVVQAKDAVPAKKSRVNSYDLIADIDRDGVGNSMDDCAGTPEGVLVDGFGCPVEMYLKVNVLFEQKDAFLGAYAENDVDQVGKLLAENPLVKVRVEGHTDNLGTPEGNMQVSKDRAKHIKQLIVQKYGVNPDRITCVGYGQSKPLVSNRLEQGRARNRRAVITLAGYYQSKVSYVALGKPVFVHFALGESGVNQRYVEQILHLAKALEKTPGAVAVIEGHTDNVGAKQSNFQLSQQRAKSVKEYLVSNYGISPDKLNVTGYGDSKPIASNDNENGRFKNRRVTITLKKQVRVTRNKRLAQLRALN